MEELVEIALDDSGDSESELEPERRDRTFVVAAKLVLEATSHVMAPGMGILDFITGFRQLLLKQDAFELPKTAPPETSWDAGFLDHLLHVYEFVEGAYSRNPPVPLSDIVYTEYAATILRPAYVVCIDRSTASVVLAIRGTHSFHDAVTDLAGMPCEVMGGTAHYGVAIAAHWFLSNLLPLLRHLLQSEPGFELIICGHSLGGAVAALLTGLLNVEIESDPTVLLGAKLSCVAFGPPGFVGMELIPRFQAMGNIITVIHQFDCVPRLSPVSGRTLMSKIKEEADKTSEALRVSIATSSAGQAVSRALASESGQKLKEVVTQVSSRIESFKATVSAKAMASPHVAKASAVATAFQSKASSWLAKAYTDMTTVPLKPVVADVAAAVAEPTGPVVRGIEITNRVPELKKLQEISILSPAGIIYELQELTADEAVVRALGGQTSFAKAHFDEWMAGASPAISRVFSSSKPAPALPTGAAVVTSSSLDAPVESVAGTTPPVPPRRSMIRPFRDPGRDFVLVRRSSELVSRDVPVHSRMVIDHLSRSYGIALRCAARYVATHKHE